MMAIYRAHTHAHTHTIPHLQNVLTFTEHAHIDRIPSHTESLTIALTFTSPVLQKGVTLAAKPILLALRNTTTLKR